MNNFLQKLLASKLRETADKLEAGTCNLTTSEYENIFAAIAHIALTKEEICDKFNISRATFDRYVANGYIPKGVKIKHKTNLIWYQDEVEQGLERLKH